MGNLLWTWGAGRPRLLVTAHVDTVFPEETPLFPRREDGALVGPGVGDNAAAVAVALHVVWGLLDAGELGAGAVAFTVGEEGLGNLRGALAACEGLRPAAVVALEGHGLERVTADAVGSVRARLGVRGPGGHPWGDRGRPSAVHGLLALGAELLARSGLAVQLNAGVISGGRSVNTIADEAELLLEARAIEEESLAEFAAELERLAVEPPLELAVEIVGRRPGGRLPRGAPLLEVVREIRAELGLPDALEAGSTDANAAVAQGIPALALGVANGSDAHSLTERIEIDSLELGRLQLERLLRRWLGP